MVFPQGIGAMAYTDCGILKPNVNKFVTMDIGAGTVEYLGIVQGKMDPKQCRSLPEGTMTIANDISQFISNQFDLDVRESDINAVMMGRESLLYDEIKDAIQDMYRRKAISFIDKAREFGMDPRIWRVFLTGGGARFVKQYFTKDNGVQKLYVEENIKANVLGYVMLAEMKIKKM